MRPICQTIGLVVPVSLRFATFKGGNLIRRERRERQAIVADLAAVAFVVYAATMPSVFLSATIIPTAFGQLAAVVVILVTLFLPQVALRLGMAK